MGSTVDRADSKISSFHFPDLILTKIYGKISVIKGKKCKIKALSSIEIISAKRN